jgi:NAD(P)H-dependent FMN reductase
MKILAFAGSSSKNSINKRLAIYAAGLFEHTQLDIIDLNDFELPLFSVDKEAELGKPEIARAFLDKIAATDIIVLSLAEHNASFSAAFKNIFDWASRQDKEVFNHKPMLLLATSPGKGGGKNVIEVAQISMPRYGADIRATFSLPLFKENFDIESGTISNIELDAQLRSIVESFKIV